MANLSSRGQQRDKPFRAALQLEIATAKDDNDGKSLRRIARVLLAQAVAGNVKAIKEIAERLDGKVPQAIVGDDSEPPVRLERIERVIVDGANVTNSDG